MKRGLIAGAALSLLIFSVTTASAYEMRHGFRNGFTGGIWVGPVWSPWWRLYPYAFPYGYDRETVVIERGPVIEEDQDTLPTAQFYWYYCKNPSGYYPYVRQCPAGWMKVVPDNVPPDMRR